MVFVLKVNALKLFKIVNGSILCFSEVEHDGKRIIFWIKAIFKLDFLTEQPKAVSFCRYDLLQSWLM